jgi:DNA polymerase-3 subunit beta
MKFSIVRSKFLDGLKDVQNIVPQKGSLPILENVLMTVEDGKLVMTTTDLDISVRSVVECQVVEKGATTLPVKLLANSVSKAAEGILQVEVDSEEKALVTAGLAKFRLIGQPAKDYPRLPEFEDSCEYSMEASTLKEMLRKTAYAASTDDTRRALKGVLFSFKDQKLTMVATDGRRLALVEKEMEFSPDSEKDIVLPSKTVQELFRMLGTEGNVKIKLHQSQVCFEFETKNVYSKLIDDVYPNYVQVIPRNTNEKVDIDRQLFLDALDRAFVMNPTTKLVFDDNKLLVASSDNERGSASDEVPIKYAGERIEIHFNPNYIMECLKAIDDDVVKMELKDGHSPVVIKCSIPFLYVLMPLRVG